ncbi:hypothetical protein MTR67_036647 [Solanum verrucosum]|uniref:NB-ARC domain-containing protein n=1 Tax=Solanum verrucosum TaxID=315347 RepID=A0AAF0ZLB2_SOLVR|nr:hypothetical protein MTR67_036647 [Solanum verrucosum]
MDDFEEKRLIKAIVESIEGKSLLGDMDLAPLQKKLQDLLNGQRYLLVLDDVWNENQGEWDNIKAVLKVGAQGASVLVTTSLERVGLIMGTLQPYELSNLSQEDCWSLFMQRAFGQEKEINPNLEAIGKEDCAKMWWCASSSQDSWRYFALQERRKRMGTLFPKDTEMEKQNLISLWIAHGFLLSKGNMELEDVGNEVWRELYSRSFFQEIELKDGKTYFKMHDLIHDLARFVFSARASSSNIREINVKIYSHMMSIGFAKVESSYSHLLVENFVSLRVLNLSNLELNQLPSSIGDLVHLRYLDLSDNFRICSLPKQL